MSISAITSKTIQELQQLAKKEENSTLHKIMEAVQEVFAENQQLKANLEDLKEQFRGHVHCPVGVIGYPLVLPEKLSYKEVEHEQGGEFSKRHTFYYTDRRAELKKESCNRR